MEHERPQAGAEPSRPEELARQVLRLSRNTLLVNLRFMDMALSRLSLQAAPLDLPDGGIATEGEHLYFSPLPVLRRYKNEQAAPVRDYLHLVMHCVFSHPFVGGAVRRDLWDLACDIAVENAITGLDLSCVTSERQQRQQAVLDKLKGALKYITAEKIYRYYLDQDPSPARVAALQRAFCADDHSFWYMPPPDSGGQGGQSGQNRSSPQKKKKGGGQNGQGDGDQNQQGSGNGQGDDDQNQQESGGLSTAQSRLKEQWKDTAERMQTDLETFSRQRGDTAGGLTQNLQAVTRERYDYREFLRRFAVRTEAMQVDLDAFDYIFYTYGMKLYGRMPLIEPLEYKDVKRIKEFVAAIDTSGSVEGELVQRFLQKTYNILKEQESWSARINLHIIQCDAAIQEDAKITTQEEFDHYLKTMKLRGFGGTDFRPVFRYVEKLCREREFVNLKGLLYFTDGYGTFPEKMPPCETAFVFVQDGYETPEVPVWAMKLILPPEEV